VALADRSVPRLPRLLAPSPLFNNAVP